MGKKAKSKSGLKKAQDRKIDKSTLPPPPPPPEDEMGSSKPLEKPSLPGTGFKVLGGEGYDDGGVADLALLIDLEDSVQRRKRGENEYFTALKADLLPRATRGPMAKMSRREQKVSLAQLLFSEDDGCEDRGPSEVYMEGVVGETEDSEIVKHRQERMQQARAALRMSLLLREPACASLSLAELCKRILMLRGPAGAADALRCAELALEIAGTGFWDGDEVAAEADEENSPEEDDSTNNKSKRRPRYKERNATTPGLANPATLKLLPIRVSHLCTRSAMLQRGNALAAVGKEEEARASYESVFPLLEPEPRCARVDWERHSLLINVGNTYSRTGDYENAERHYGRAEAMGVEHLEASANDETGGSLQDGKDMVAGAKRARAIALKKNGRVEEARAVLKEVVEQQIKDNLLKEAEKKKKEEEEKEKKENEEDGPVNDNGK